MSDNQTKFLTDVDRLILKLDEIIINTGGKKDDATMNYKNIKNRFELLALTIDNSLKEMEALLLSRNKILNSTNPKEIYDKRKIENKIESLLEEIEIKIKELKQELRILKNKEGKYGNFTKKENIINLIEQKYQLFKNEFEGVDDFDMQKSEDIKSNMEQLEEILSKENKNFGERELSREEKEKIREWNNEVKRQDEELNKVHDTVKKIKEEVNLASKNIEITNSNVNKLTHKTEKVTKNVHSKNKSLKNLINKLRSGDKLCIDIILILVALGLLAILYNIIKSRFF